MLTSAQIITLACQAAKAPGYTTQAGQFLNARLVQLAVQQDLDIVRRFFKFQAIIGNSGPYILPANYQRARQVFYYNNGVSYDLDQRSIEDFNRLFQGPGLSDYPYLFATDVAGSMGAPNQGGNIGTPTNPNTNVNVPVMYLYPQPVVALTIECLYFDTSVEIPNPVTSATVPWYPDGLALVKDVTQLLMLLTDDERRAGLKAELDNDVARYLQMDDDKEQRTLRVKMDTMNFRTARRSVRPTKLQGD
jgi:hypothetical protein